MHSLQELEARNYLASEQGLSNASLLIILRRTVSFATAHGAMNSRKMKSLRNHVNAKRSSGSAETIRTSKDVRPPVAEYHMLQLLASIVRSSKSAIVSTSASGTVTSWNGGAERLFGYSAPEMIGRPIARLFVNNVENAQLLRFAEGRAAEHIDHYEAVRLCKSGGRIAVSVSVSPLRDASDRIVGMCEISRTVPAWQRADRNAGVRDRLAAMALLASRIAHEINNPLNAVTNLLFLLEQEGLSANGTRYAAMAHRELERLARISVDGLSLYRSSGQPSVTSIADLLETALAEHHDRCVTQHVDVVRDYWPIEMISCHPEELRRAFMNLLGNAIDSMPRGGILHLRVREGSDWATNRCGSRITISDTGNGMTGESGRMLFQPHLGTKHRAGGGLGLWTCAHVIAKYGGHILVRGSKGRGRKGTVLLIFLPR